MGCPILLDTHRNKTVQTHRRREHIGCHCVVVVLILTHLRCNFDERLHNAFRPAIHKRRHAHLGQILLDDVHKCVGNAARNLIGWQRECGFGIEDRELRIVGVKCIFFGSCGVRDHRTVVHLRTCCGQGHHRRKGQHTPLGAPREGQLPRVAIVVYGRGDQLRSVEHRAATYGQQKFDSLRTTLLHSAAQRLDLRVGLDAPKFDVVTSLQRLDDLLIDTVSAHRATAKCDHNLLVGGDFACQTCNHSSTEQNLRGIAKAEIIHSRMWFSKVNLHNCSANLTLCGQIYNTAVVKLDQIAYL